MTINELMNEVAVGLDAYLGDGCPICGRTLGKQVRTEHISVNGVAKTRVTGSIHCSNPNCPFDERVLDRTLEDGKET